jgi:hypothetical protein
MDLSGVSTEDLLAFKEGRLQDVSTNGLLAIQKAKQGAQPAPQQAADPSLGQRLKGAAVDMTANTLGAPVDFANWLLKQTGLPMSDKPFLGSNNIKDVMTSGNDRYGPTDAIANSMTFGTLPNIKAGVAAATGGDYEANLKAEREARKQYREQNPGTNAVLEVAGGAATGGALAKNGVTLLGRMADEGLKNLLPRMAAGAAEGMAYSAAAGAGGAEGDTAKERLANSAKEAGDNLFMGAVTGAAAPAVVDLVKGAGNMARNAYMGIKDPGQRAKEFIVQRIMSDAESTPATLAKQIEEAIAAGQPEYTAADAGGRNLQKGLGLASRTPGPGRDKAFGVVNSRQEAQGERIGKFVDEALGVKGENAYATEQALTKGMKEKAAAAYEAAYAAEAPNSPFYSDLFKKPIVQKAVANMRAAAENSIDGMPGKINLQDMYAPTVPGQPLPKDDSQISGLSVKGWDYVKRYLDTTVNSLYSSSNAEDKALAPVYKELRDTLKKQLATDNPAYGEALKQFSDDKAAIDAIEAGRQLATSRNPDEAKAAFSSMEDGNKNLARVGAAREFGVKLENAGQGIDKTRMLGTPNAQTKLDVLAVSPEARAALGQPGLATGSGSGRLGREADMARVRNIVTGGSPTEENMADRVASDSGSLLSALLRGNPAQATGRGVELFLRTGQGLTPTTAQHVVDTLLSNDPQRIGALAELFDAMQRQATAPSLAPSMLISGTQIPRQKNDERGGRK